MATPAQIRTQVDNKLAQLWASIQTKQDNYLATHGTYWQGLKTHTVYPADGNTSIPNVGSNSPSYQNDPWPNAILIQSLPMAIEIHQYIGPNGRGYVGFVYVTIAGNTFYRSQDSGPEPWRTQGWTQLIAPN